MDRSSSALTTNREHTASAPSLRPWFARDGTGLGPRHRALVLYDLAALVLLLWSTWILARVAPHMGETYGGFLWIYDVTRDPPFYVSFFPWRTTPSAPFRLWALDHLLTIQDQPADRYPQVYAALRPGDPVRYLVAREGRVLTIVEPAHRFTLDIFIAVYGLHYLMILSCLWAGRVLMRSSPHPHRRVLAWLPLLAALAMCHALWAMDSFDGPSVGSSIWFPFLAFPITGLGGAILFHSLLLYAQPQNAGSRRGWLSLLYIPPLLLGLAMRLVQLQGPGDQEPIQQLFRLQFLYASVCMVAAGWLALRLWPRVRRGQGPVAWQAFRSLLLVVGILVVGLLGLWWIPFLLTGWPLVPYEVLLAMGVIFPLGVVYALTHSDLIQSLERTAREAQALRRSRDQLLHRLADRIHDRVLPQLQGARMLLEGLPRSGDAQTAGDLADTVAVLQEAVAELRGLLEAAKPIDWSRHALGELAAWTAARRSRLYPGTTVRVETAAYDEADPPSVKEAAYRILSEALNNALHHGRARQVRVVLRAEGDALWLEVVDDGVGFDPRAVDPLGPARRHQGLAAMQARAEEVGGRLTVESTPGRGTRVRLEVPRTPDGQGGEA